MTLSACDGILILMTNSKPHALTDSKLSPAAMDELVRQITAFVDAADLLAHMADGYTPTLSRRSPTAKLLGSVLEHGGLGVFWIH